jgi:hypothetical protein
MYQEKRHLQVLRLLRSRAGASSLATGFHQMVYAAGVAVFLYGQAQVASLLRWEIRKI